jgi:pimeloyl-ACP methyl ester carboxylesterase
VEQLRVACIPDGSHWVVHEQPARVAALIRGFLT